MSRECRSAAPTIVPRLRGAANVTPTARCYFHTIKRSRGWRSSTFLCWVQYCCRDEAKRWKRLFWTHHFSESFYLGICSSSTGVHRHEQIACRRCGCMPFNRSRTFLIVVLTESANFLVGPCSLRHGEQFRSPQLIFSVCLNRGNLE